MTDSRLADYLDHMRQAIADASGYVVGMSRDDFLADRRTQQAVVMNLVIIGETATRILDAFPKFAAEHTEIPWRSMRGMRNRIAHGYFEIDFDVVWDTVQDALPDLLNQLAKLDGRTHFNS